MRYGRAWREDEESIRNLPVTARGVVHGPSSTPSKRETRVIPLAEVADIEVVEGPASIKSENGLLRNYVRVNVRDRDAADLVAEAKLAVAKEAKLPEGVFVEWTGQFEHALRARRTLTLVVPVVVAMIFLVLYLTYHDLADAVLMLLAVPGAIAGGLFFQSVLGMKLSVTVWVGYIACFGMATSTGIIMLVYLREAVAKAGGLEHINLAELRSSLGRSRAQTPAETLNGGNRGGRAGPDALGHRSRLRDHPANGGAGAGWNSGGGRSDRPVPTGIVLLGPTAAVGAVACRHNH